MLIKLRVASLGVDPRDGRAVIFLVENDGHRVFPIWASDGDAHAVADALYGRRQPRPATTELLTALIHGLGAAVRAVRITGVAGGVVSAEVIVTHADDDVSFDARPSDAICVAVRSDAPVLIEDGLLAQVADRIDDAVTRLKPSTRVAAEPMEQSTAERWNQLLSHLSRDETDQDRSDG